MNSRGPPGGLIGMYADACEQIAYVYPAYFQHMPLLTTPSATDASFAAVWGTRFHRDVSNTYTIHMLTTFCLVFISYWLTY